jgi:hypothetical protein
MDGAIGAAVTLPLRAKQTPNQWSKGFGTQKVPKSFQIPNYFTPFPKSFQILEHFQKFRIKSETLPGCPPLRPSNESGSPLRFLAGLPTLPSEPAYPYSTRLQLDRQELVLASRRAGNPPWGGRSAAGSAQLPPFINSPTHSSSSCSPGSPGPPMDGLSPGLHAPRHAPPIPWAASLSTLFLPNR